MMYWLLLILGVALWTIAHFWKRIAPDHRAAFGDKGKGIAAGLIVVAIILMVIGYRGAEGPVFWGPSSALVGINNLLMLFAFYLFAASGAKSGITRRIKNPQLTGFKAFALAHLLVNGDLASFVLFGGLLGWAVAEVILLKRAGVPWERPAPASMQTEVKVAIGALVVMLVVMVIHYLLGVQPWG